MMLPAVFALGLLGCSHAGTEQAPSPTQASKALPDALWQHWVHSFEEDGRASRAYRPRSYAFPRARGREGFELQPRRRVRPLRDRAWRRQRRGSRHLEAVAPA